MRAPRTAVVAHKKPDADLMKKHKTERNEVKKEKASKKNSGAPKRPATAFFVFMEDFRKIFKESNPDIKSGPAVGKAGGEKWKSMSESEKAVYIAMASKRKAEYEKAVEAYEKRNNKGGDEKAESSDKSTSEVHDGAEEADSS